MTDFRLNSGFFGRDVLEVAPGLIGKILVRRFDKKSICRFVITETEAYRGVNDLACHASKGKGARTEIMFEEGGYIYTYLIYGMYWMLNVVAGEKNDASAVLIRGLENIPGPGRVGRRLEIDKSFYGENLFSSERIWIEDSKMTYKIKSSPRIGITYAGEPWISRP